MSDQLDLAEDIRQWDEYVNGVGGLDSLSYDNRKRNKPSQRHQFQQKDAINFILSDEKPEAIRVHKLGSRKSRDFNTLTEEDLIREYGA